MARPLVDPVVKPRKINRNYEGMRTCYPTEVEIALRVMAGYNEGHLTRTEESRAIARALLHLGATVRQLD